jgi:hypothetical protein
VGAVEIADPEMDDSRREVGRAVLRDLGGFRDRPEGAG